MLAPWFGRLRRVAPLLVGAALFAVAIALLRRELAEHGYRELIARSRALPVERIWFSIALTAASYFVLTRYDALALEHVGVRLERWRTSLTSFIAYVASANLGLSWIGGGAVRYRLYTACGLSALDVTAVTLFVGATSWLGLLTLSGAALTFAPGAAAGALSLSPLVLRAIGVFALSVVAAYVATSVRRTRPWIVRGVELRAPKPWMALRQVALSCADWSIASLVLYALLPAAHSVGTDRWIVSFTVASALAMLSHVPGGLGVFELSMIRLLAPDVAAPDVVAGLLVYRGVYYLAPLMLGVVAFGGLELGARRSSLREFARKLDPLLAAVAPTFLALAVFAGGVVLLVSGATPPISERHAWLRSALGLGWIETSHLAASLIGVALLAVADAVRRRVDAAFHLVLALLAAGAVSSLAKGLDWEEATLLLIVFVAFLPARRWFDRRAAILHGDFDAAWWIALVCVVAASAGLALFVHARSDLGADLWWRFELDGHVPRSLRASFAALIAGVAIVATRALRPTAPFANEDARVDALVDTVVRASPRTTAHLAWTGDKRFVLSADQRAFVMYAISARSWVAMGDAIGAPEARRDATWRFVELARRFGGRAVFYQVRPDDLALYAELGLTLLKLGENAHVDLRTFALEGHARKPLRHSVNALEKAGFTFEVAEFGSERAPASALRVISEAWLAEEQTREKRFSVGCFDEAYLARTPIALVRRGATIVAFANLWIGADKAELSVDLMRSSAEAPSGAMVYLFTRAMLWGREQGFARFDLGMSPLSGLDARPGAPLWNHVGALVQRHGEHFYNFEGLRAFKDKFDPTWEARYLAAPGGLALASALRDVAALVGGGLRGVVAK